MSRFLTVDPFEGILSIPVTFQPYTYGASDPLNRTDPTGMFFGFGGFATQMYIGVKAASAALNVYSAASNLVNGYQALSSGDPLGAAMAFAVGAVNIGFAAMDIFGPLTPPPSAGMGFASAVGAGSTARQFRQLVIHAPGLARWIHQEVMPAMMRSAAGVLGIMFANGFQEVRSGTESFRQTTAGTAHGGEDLPAIAPGQSWLDQDMGLVPKQVADQLRGKYFMNWNVFREAFWKAVYNVPQLRSQFKEISQVEMSAGRAPFAPKHLQVGGQIKFEIDHMEPISIGWERILYDLDNLLVVAPKHHNALTAASGS